MLTEHYIEALLVDEELADSAFERLKSQRALGESLLTLAKEPILN